MADDRRVLRYELTFQDVIQILQLADQQSTFRELQIELDGLKLRLETGRGAEPATPSSLPISRQPLPASPDQGGRSSAVATGDAAGEAAARPETADGIAVTSVTGGIFYRAPGPGEPPFAEAGQAVSAGDTLGLIELMKLFTPVTAPVAGTVRAFRAANEEVVKAGQVLVVIVPVSD